MDLEIGYKCMYAQTNSKTLSKDFNTVQVEDNCKMDDIHMTRNNNNDVPLNSVIQADLRTCSGLALGHKQGSASSIFDPANLPLDQDFDSKVGVKKVYVLIHVKKPNGQEFIRVHPDEAMRLETAVLELKEGNCSTPLGAEACSLG